MPVVIIQRHFPVPSVMETATDEEMLDWLRSRKWVPNHARASTNAARAWVAAQPRPSGWFDSMEAARAWLRARPHPAWDDGADTPAATVDA